MLHLPQRRSDERNSGGGANELLVAQERAGIKGLQFCHPRTGRDVDVF